MIEHPDHNLPIAKREGRLRDDAAMVRLSQQQWSLRISKDPFGASQFGAEADFGGDWRSASSPVRVPGADGEFLLAMVRESVDLVQKPLRSLRTNLYWLGVAVAGLFVLPLVILLVLLTRRPQPAAVWSPNTGLRAQLTGHWSRCCYSICAISRRAAQTAEARSTTVIVRHIPGSHTPLMRFSPLLIG